MTKLNTRLSLVRPALLGVALLLTGIAMMTPAFAACTNGATRSVIVSPICCGAYPPPKATKQNQKCIGGVWTNQGSPYCGSVSTCTF